MKWKYYIVFFLSVGVLVLSFVFVQSAVAKEKEIKKEGYHKHKITIDYPVISNPSLQMLVNQRIAIKKEAFLASIRDFEAQKDLEYYFCVTYRKYESASTVSYVFYIDTFTGGAHPNQEIFSIVFDSKANQEMTIDDLLKEDSLFLLKASKSVRGDLIFHSSITNTSMMMEGTRPIKANFETFAITNQNIIFFFAPYQVAPYSSGSFEVPVNLELFSFSF